MYIFKRIPRMGIYFVNIPKFVCFSTSTTTLSEYCNNILYDGQPTDINNTFPFKRFLLNGGNKSIDVKTQRIYYSYRKREILACCVLHSTNYITIGDNSNINLQAKGSHNCSFSYIHNYYIYPTYYLGSIIIT